MSNSDPQQALKLFEVIISLHFTQELLYNLTPLNNSLQSSNRVLAAEMAGDPVTLQRQCRANKIILHAVNCGRNDAV